MKKIKLLTSLVSLPVLGMVTVPLTSCQVEGRLIFNCSSRTITFTDLPKVWKDGDGDVNATYTYDTKTLKFDEANSDILVAAKSIKSEEGVEYKDGKVKIPATLMTGPVVVKILVAEKANHSIVNESSESVTISGLNETWYEGDGDISATYTVDSSVQFDAENSDILVDTISIKSQPGVVYTDGKIVIPSSLIIGTITIKIATAVKPGQLSNTIDEIIDACNTYEKSSRSTAAKKAFIQSFKINDVPLTSIDSLIGSTFIVKISDQDHIVRIIDFEHDNMYDETSGLTTGKAALTCDLAQLLSNPYGAAKTTQWDSSKNYNYTKSVFRANLTGKGGATKTFGDTALTLLTTGTPSLAADGVIKNVQKSVSISLDSGNTYNVTAYSDKLFPLTYTEMGLSNEVQYFKKIEGTEYKYWSNHKTKNDRIKRDVANYVYNYWLTSPTSVPYSTVTDTSYYIDNTGELYAEEVTKQTDMGVSFAFCI